ncbi:DNA-binding PadR family transcriptional regulator [Breznakia blatticola]|uniref:DNA-binding PadR family transcriptional regulator n=1 Tax=Breznakia blatticola TaxID=1754012 RepID=A0A4R8A5V7_9FIRM|nr:PadR family transcriptional regulator [Breznakia blatticola]TDW26057.1 DNA-binding PadR family transcriptional regulator [Breznakia blatticola]
MGKQNNIFKMELLVLSVLNQNTCYGYEITTTIKQLSSGIFDDIKEGTLYPILYNLVENKYVESYNKIVNNRVRVYYKLTDEGQAYFENQANIFLENIEIIQEIVKRGLSRNE